ncbi:Tn3 family transposase [Streptomyces chattanoogensis]|uniref:Tn3 family transposase n=1 Tax=Streptomyces chattanoogensis TaxID=66876 RepID=UPI003CCB8401
MEGSAPRGRCSIGCARLAQERHLHRFREVGRIIRTVQLLRYLTEAQLCRRATAATNKVESFNRFSQWAGFGNRGPMQARLPWRGCSEPSAPQGFLRVFQVWPRDFRLKERERP